MSMWFQGDQNLGPQLIPSVFAASIAGGFLSIHGAIAGGIFVGLIEVLGTRFISGEVSAWFIVYRLLIPLIFIVVTLFLALKGLAEINWSRLKKNGSRGIIFFMLNDCLDNHELKFHK